MRQRRLCSRGPSHLHSSFCSTSVIVDGSLRLTERPAVEGQRSGSNFAIVADRVLMWTGRPRREDGAFSQQNDAQAAAAAAEAASAAVDSNNAPSA